MSRTAKTVLSEIKVVLNNEGNVEVEYSNVPLKEFESEMNRKVPDYENTYIIAGFMKKLHKLSSDYYNSINKLLI
jgi:hypothetical protein|tara:strand:- start:747 stop:971 length:225 start_codon:yes stop_codon:yes gene_type:complete